MARGECAAASKQECLEAHGHGQDLREQGRLTRAREAFMSCAQSSCPALIQGDCARFAEEIERLVPSVSFAARDAQKGDLFDTAVYVDGDLVATRLDDGKSFDFDPGKHAVRFVHGTRESLLTVVLNQGEKGRALVATFEDPRAPAAASRTSAPVPAAAPPAARRAVFPLVVAGVGAAAMLTGGVLFGVGMSKVPANCSFASHDCAAAPGDPAFGDAHAAVAMSNLGLGVGIGGAALLAGGLVWYFTQTPKVADKEPGVARAFAPWVGRESGGVAFSGSF
jgi:hypothetical protein